MIGDFSIFKDLVDELQKINSSTHYSMAKLENKEDGSPVTDFDTKLNDCIISFIKKNYPNDGIVTEEIKEPFKGTSNRCWFVDPLDGTKEYLKGLPEWAVQIGLVENNEVIFGLVAPLDFYKVYYATKNNGSYSWDFKNNMTTKLECRSVNDITEISILTSRSRSDARLDNFLIKNNITKQIPMGSLGVKLAAICEKKADLYMLFSGQCNLWDICAPEIILREAGGYVAHFDGSPINYNSNLSQAGKPLLACTKSVWEIFKKNKTI